MRRIILIFFAFLRKITLLFSAKIVFLQKNYGYGKIHLSTEKLDRLYLE